MSHSVKVPPVLTRPPKFITHPTTATTLIALGILTLLAIVGGVAFAGSAFGNACAIAFVPALSVAIGVVAHRWYSGRNQDRTALQLQQSVRYVNDRLRIAAEHLENGQTYGAALEIVRAQTTTELSLAFGAPDTAVRPPSTSPVVINTDDNRIEGSVARVEDQSTVIINRGSEHGVTPQMLFAVMADDGDPLIDPETGREIGRLPSEALRVKVFDVRPEYSQARPLRRASEPKVAHSRVTAPRPPRRDVADVADARSPEMLKRIAGARPHGTTSRAEALPTRGTADMILSGTLPQDDPQPEVTVDIGAKVRQVAPGSTGSD